MNRFETFTHSALTVNDLKRALPDGSEVRYNSRREDEDYNDYETSAGLDNLAYIKVLLDNLKLRSDFLLIENSRSIFNAVVSTTPTEQIRSRIDSQVEIGIPGVVRNGVIVTTAEDFVIALAELILVDEVNQLGKTDFPKDYKGFSTLVRWCHIARFFHATFSLYGERKEFFEQQKFYHLHPYFTVDDWQQDVAEVFDLSHVATEKRIIFQMEQRVYTPSVIVKRLNERINQLRRIRMREFGTIHTNTVEWF